MRIAPLPPDHFTPAGDGQHALAGGGIELREPAREVSSSADEARRRGQRVGRIVTGDHHAPPERQLGAVAMSDRARTAATGMSGSVSSSSAGVDDRLLDPAAIGRSRYRLDDETGKAIAVVRIFEAGVWLDYRCRRKIGPQLRRVEEWAAVLPLTAVAPVANDAGAVREKLRDRGLRNRRMEAVDVLSDAGRRGRACPASRSFMMPAAVKLFECEATRNR